MPNFFDIRFLFLPRWTCRNSFVAVSTLLICLAWHSYCRGRPAKIISWSAPVWVGLRPKWYCHVACCYGSELVVPNSVGFTFKSAWNQIFCWCNIWARLPCYGCSRVTISMPNTSHLSHFYWLQHRSRYCGWTVCSDLWPLAFGLHWHSRHLPPSALVYLHCIFMLDWRRPLACKINAWMMIR